MVVAALVGGVVWNAQRPEPPALTGTCSVAGTSIELTSAQAANAATIAAVGRARGLPERAVVVALATAQQESRLRNLDYGDRDSLGLFQQRPSQGWGTEAQVQDPVYAANAFYDGLVEVPGWPEMRVTDAAQRVQRSGFPEAYQRWQPLGEQLTAALGGAPTALSCSFQPAPVEGRPSVRTAAAAAAAEAELRLPATEGFAAVTLDPAAGWAGAAWAVAHAERLQLAAVEFAGQRWTPEAGWLPEPGAGDVVRLDIPT
ncbi:hypothetical protein OF117_08395 [Geodermatophilus sp. YIM 151500]|uniref:hypothetical protein n=1 Tax=Geodermatophilus sp. YIM 151500 TaxID=2984531 RepID=UPI0021E3ED62|nr:hypothetical protein [Geodermatophilus sp. YIM 151500]MCV2489385.1 hypothetical protein [Geodermatophilus sp. YIM 151500]